MFYEMTIYYTTNDGLIEGQDSYEVDNIDIDFIKKFYESYNLILDKIEIDITYKNDSIQKDSYNGSYIKGEYQY